MRSVLDLEYEPVPDSEPIAQAIREALPSVGVIGLSKDDVKPGVKGLWVADGNVQTVIQVPVIALQMPDFCAKLVPMICDNLERARVKYAAKT